jgi:two-component system, chemotaxis family, response regulator Rcp1
MELQTIDILIVEDNPGDVRLFKEFFRDIRMMNKITWASDGDEAMAIVRRDVPGLVLLDMFIPKMTGAEVLKEIRSNPDLSEVRVIIVCGTCDDEQVRKMAPGADAYVAKPVNMESLGAAVSKIRSFGISVVKVIG